MRPTDQPIVICGLGRMAQHVLDYLHAAGLPVVVVDNRAKPDDQRLQGARLVQGDCRQRAVLEAAGVANARGVLVLTSDDLLNTTTAMMARSINRDVRIVLRMFNQNLVDRMGNTVRNVFAISTSLLTAPLLATAALTGQALGTFRIDQTPGGLRQLVEASVSPASPLLGQTVGGLCVGRPDVQVLAHLPGVGEPRVLLAVSPEARLQEGDRLILCGPPAALAPLLETGEEEAGRLRWAGWLRRAWRIVKGTLAEIDLGVLLCTLVLVLTLAVSTAVLSLGVPAYSQPHKAFIRSVSIMATGAPLDEQDYHDRPGISVFVACLRIAGAALLAAFTAIVTNYLIRARLGGVLEARRVPEGGHVIVCGLSPVGFRVTEELARLGEPVVIIEQNESCRFVATARRLGAAVMIGDASVIEVLRQANAATARAVIGATSNDMTNLEVALLARELNPNSRVVVLAEEPQFAALLRQAADIRLAVSRPAMAAPACVAGLFGDRVLNVFLLGERLCAALDLEIKEGDPFVGQPLRAVARDYGLLPVALLHPAKTLRTVLGTRLEPGDRVVALCALSDMERLLAREPVPANHEVVVSACPLPTVPWLASLLRALKGIPAEEAEQAVRQFPLTLSTGLTRGQAEDLLLQLNRERVTAHLGAEAPGAGTH